MDLFWLGASVYLVFSLVALWGAEVRAAPGCTPSIAEMCWASLCFALARPFLGLIERLTARG